jgi:hypothetical protein
LGTVARFITASMPCVTFFKQPLPLRGTYSGSISRILLRAVTVGWTEKRSEIWLDHVRLLWWNCWW